MDTWLSNCRPRFVFGRGVIAKSRVTALPIIEHLDILEDVLLRFFTGHVVPMVDEFKLSPTCGEHGLVAMGACEECWRDYCECGAEVWARQEGG